jgi:hypothetical protein
MLSSHTDVGPIVWYQDNKSTICLDNKGRSTSERTRHTKVRYVFIRHYIDTNEIVVEYMPTADMIADILCSGLVIISAIISAVGMYSTTISFVSI